MTAFWIGSVWAQSTRPGFEIAIPRAISSSIATNERSINKPDTPAVPYTNLEYEKTEVLNAAPGTKSVLFNGEGTKLYAMNLEGMSVYEFDQSTKNVTREFKFKPTRGTGWDYEKDKPIASYQEKPVEACLSHNDKILWVSLHNAEGIVPIRMIRLVQISPPNLQPRQK